MYIETISILRIMTKGKHPTELSIFFERKWKPKDLMSLGYSRATVYRASARYKIDVKIVDDAENEIKKKVFEANKWKQKLTQEIE